MCFICRNADYHRLHHHPAQILQVTDGGFLLHSAADLPLLFKNNASDLIGAFQVQIYELEEHKLETWRG